MAAPKILSAGKVEAIQERAKWLETKETIKALTEMKEIMNKAFGEENNQIIPVTEEGTIQCLVDHGYTSDHIHIIRESETEGLLRTIPVDFQVIIKFPEITIKNSKKKSHLIKDLYVKFKVTKDGKFSGYLAGLRSTLSEAEFRARYLHSHLRSLCPDNIHFEPFCTGVGEINQVMSVLRTKYDEINFTLFCLHLKNYVAWESLEGTPHMHMGYIGVDGFARGRRGNNTLARETAVNILKSALFEDTERLKNFFKIHIAGSKVEVKASDEFEIWAAHYIQKVDPNEFFRGNPDIGNNQFLFLKNSVGVYVSTQSAAQVDIFHQETPLFKFKGGDIFLTVIKEEKHEIKATKYIDPDITQKLCNDLSRDFSKIALNSERIEEQEDSSVSIRETAESDHFPL